MSSNCRAGSNPSDDPMPQDFENLLAGDDDFLDTEEAEESVFVSQDYGTCEEVVEEGSGSDMGDEPAEYSDAEDQAPVDISALPIVYIEEAGVEVELGDSDGAGPSRLSLPPPPSPPPSPLAMDVDAVAGRAEDDRQHGEFGGHGNVNSDSDGEVDPGARNDCEWLPDERVGDRGHAAVGGRGGTAVGAAVGARGGRGPRGGAAGNAGWVRGEELTEVFPTDDDLPLEMRERFAREVPRERVEREAEAVNVDDENDVMQEYARLCADEGACRFDWKPMNSFQGVKEQFRVEATGPTRIFQTGYDAFRAIWDSATVCYIAEQTNAYAAGAAIANDHASRARWYDTNEHEIMLLFAFWMMLAVVPMPSINSCFSNDPYLYTVMFRKLFTKRRYWDLNRALRFSQDTTDEVNPDKLRDIRVILNMLNDKFQTLYTPSQDICIDESLTLWKGNVSFRQYIKTKAAKYGIKTFELCESSTGYLWSFFVYTGAELGARTAAVGKTAQTVLRLIHPLLRKGYTVFMDNWFNSPLLARFLKLNQTDCVGTLRRNRQNVPPIIANIKLRQGSYIARHANNVVLVSLNDRKPVSIISTYHNTGTRLTVPRRGHPSEHRFVSVSDYNAGMGGVDRKDQMLEAYRIERKQCINWFIKLFKRLMNASILNCRILVRQSDPERAYIEQLKFRLDLVKAIVDKHLHLARRQAAPAAPAAEPAQPAVPLPAGPPMMVYRENFPACRRDQKFFHCPVLVGGNVVQIGGGRKKRLRCVWCTHREHKEKKTTHECKICKVPLCMESCFEKFHTLP